MPRSNAFPVIGLAFALVALGCSSEPSSGLVAETDQEIYSPEASIQVQLVNNSDADVRYQTCPGQWDRKGATGYTRFETLEACTRNVTTVAAGETVEVDYTIPDGLALGIWRIAVPIGPDALTDEVPTNDFEIVVFER